MVGKWSRKLYQKPTNSLVVVGRSWHPDIGGRQSEVMLLLHQLLCPPCFTVVIPPKKRLAFSAATHGFQTQREHHIPQPNRQQPKARSVGKLPLEPNIAKVFVEKSLACRSCGSTLKQAAMCNVLRWFLRSCVAVLRLQCWFD